MDEITQYAFDKGTRRLGTIESARGRPVREIDEDYTLLEIEEVFAAEDAAVLSESDAA